MSEPAFFISHFRVKEGKLDAVRQLTRDVAQRLEAQKPRTVLFLSFLDEQGGVIHFLHAFPDAQSMDAHFEGSDERAGAAYELVSPLGWEFYGRISDAALETMRKAAVSSGATLSVHPDYVAGFLRLVPAT